MSERFQQTFAKAVKALAPQLDGLSPDDKRAAIIQLHTKIKAQTATQGQATAPAKASAPSPSPAPASAPLFPPSGGGVGEPGFAGAGEHNLSLGAGLAGLGKGVLDAAASLIPIGRDPDEARFLRKEGKLVQQAVAQGRDKQEEYRQRQLAERGGHTFLENLEHGGAAMFKGLADMPAAVVGGLTKGPQHAFDAGANVGEVVTRDLGFLVQHPGEALHGDPTRILDVAPGLKAAGAGARAAKGVAKAAGKARTATGLGVLAELVDPSPAQRPTLAVGKQTPTNTTAGTAVAMTGDRLVAGKNMDYAAFQKNADRMGAQHPKVESVAPEPLSRAEQIAGKVGRNVRTGVVGAALGSSVANPIVAAGAAIGAVHGGGAALRAGSKAAARRKADVNLSDAEAAVDLHRTVADPNSQATSYSEQAVRNVAVDPIHEEQAIKTTTVPIASAIERGDIAKLSKSINPNPEALDIEPKREFPTEKVAFAFDLKKGRIIGAPQETAFTRHYEVKAIAAQQGALADELYRKEAKAGLKASAKIFGQDPALVGNAVRSAKELAVADREARAAGMALSKAPSTPVEEVRASAARLKAQTKDMRANLLQEAKDVQAQMRLDAKARRKEAKDAGLPRPPRTTIPGLRKIMAGLPGAAELADVHAEAKRTTNQLKWLGRTGAPDNAKHLKARELVEGLSAKVDEATQRATERMRALHPLMRPLIEDFVRRDLRVEASSAKALQAAKERRIARIGKPDKEPIGPRLQQRGVVKFEEVGDVPPWVVRIEDAITKILGGGDDAAKRVRDVIVRGVNEASMQHILSPRVVGKVAKDFVTVLNRNGVTTEAIAKSEGFLASRFNSRLHGRLDTQVQKYLERELQEVVVNNIQPSIVGGKEVLPFIEIPGHGIFDIREAMTEAIARLDGRSADVALLPAKERLIARMKGKGGVAAATLYAEGVSAAFRELASQHLEAKTRGAVAQEAIRGQIVVADAKGVFPSSAAQLGVFAAESKRGLTPNIVLFDTSRGSLDMGVALSDPRGSVSAAKNLRGEDIAEPDIESSLRDLTDNFVTGDNVPPVLREALYAGLADSGVKLPAEVGISVRYGYAQSVGVHLEYLAAVRQVETVVGTALRQLKWGMTIGSTGTMVANVLSNLVLVGVSTGKGIAGVLSDWAREASLMRSFEDAVDPMSKDHAITEALLRTGIADSSLAHEFGQLHIAGDSTKSLPARIWDIYWGARAGVYKQADAIPKMALSRGQMVQLLDDVDDLEPGQSIWLDQGGGNYTKLHRDDAGELRMNNAAATQTDVYTALARQATRSAAAALFDFNETGLMFKGLVKGGKFGVFNELGSWFFKSLEMPGRQGIFSTAMFFDPRSSYLTTSPKLLEKKAKSFTALMLRRSALHTSVRAVQDIQAQALGDDNSPIAGAFGYGGVSATKVSGHDPDESGYDVNVMDISSAAWTGTLAIQAEAAVAGFRGLLDLSGFSDALGSRREVAAAMDAVLEGQRPFNDYKGMAPQQAAEARVMDRMIRSRMLSASGREQFLVALLDMSQLTGGVMNRVVQSKSRQGEIAKALLQTLVMGIGGRDAVVVLGAALDGNKAEMFGRKAAKDYGPEETQTSRAENPFRFLLSGMFRVIGREKNSEAAITASANRLLSHVSKQYRGARSPEALVEAEFTKAMIREEAERARAMVFRLNQ